MNSPKKYRLKDLGEFYNGINFSRAEKGGKDEDSLGLINVKDLYGDRPWLGLDSLDRVTLTTRRNLSKFKVHAGDIYFARSSVKRDGIGVVKLAPHDEPRTLHCGFVIRFRCTNEDAVPLYLTYLLRSPMMRAEIMNLSGGAAITNISQDSLGRLEISLPSPEAQRWIASILSAYDDLIENNRRRIAVLEEMARRVYEEWFVKFRYPGHPDSFVHEGKPPQKWDTEKLEDVANLVMGQSPKSEFYNDEQRGLPFHQGVKDFGDYFPTNRQYCTADNRIAEKHDILFSVRAPVGRINIARQRMVIGRGLSAIRSKSGFQAFLLEALRHQFAKEDSIGSGTIFNAVTKRDMQQIEIISPPVELVEQFERFAAPVWRMIELLTTTIENLSDQRGQLLPRLVSGQIEIDASVVVEAGCSG